MRIVMRMVFIEVIFLVNFLVFIEVIFLVNILVLIEVFFFLMNFLVFIEVIFFVNVTPTDAETKVSPAEYSELPKNLYLKALDHLLVRV